MSGVALSRLLFVADLGHDLSYFSAAANKNGKILSRNELTLRLFTVTTPNTTIFYCFISSMWVL
jgi:hypothetical protein